MAGKRLITEADVRAMAPGARIALGPDAIATPAALDAAFQRGIPVSYGAAPAAGAGGGPCGGACGSSCAGSCGKLWSRLLAQDGTYVVQVSGGHAAVTRICEQGPVAFGSV